MTSTTGFITRIFVWDTESTNIQPTEADIVSLGGVLCSFDDRTRKFTMIDEFHTLINTNKAMDAVSEGIHHISKSMLRDEPKFPEAISILTTFLRQHQPEANARLVMAAHNGAKFDEIILYANFVQHRMDFEEFLREVRCCGFLDTLKMLRAVFKPCTYQEQPKDAATGRTSYALGHCFESFCGSVMEGAHDALADSQGLFRILNAECVTQRFSLQTLYKHVVKKEKNLKRIRQTAGASFQNQEERTRMESFAPMDATATPEAEVEPIFRTLPSDQTSPFRLCVSCIRFVPATKAAEHQCSETRAVVEAIE